LVALRSGSRCAQRTGQRHSCANHAARVADGDARRKRFLVRLAVDAEIQLVQVEHRDVEDDRPVCHRRHRRCQYAEAPTTDELRQADARLASAQHLGPATGQREKGDAQRFAVALAEGRHDICLA